MIQMYDGVVNSIETVTTGAINATDTIINVLDETRIPEAPNILVLGSGASAETVKLVEKNGSVLTVERGLQGTAKSWASGTLVARNFTEYDHKAFKENIEELAENQDQTSTQLAQMESFAEFELVANTSIPNGSTSDVALQEIKIKPYCTIEAGLIRILASGTYEIKASLNYAINNIGSRHLYLKLNNTIIDGIHVAPVGLFSTQVKLSKFLDLQANDVIGFTVRQTSGGALDVLKDIYTSFQFKKVG